MGLPSSSETAEAIALDPHDPAFQQCPYPTLSALRRTEPVHRVEALDAWYVTSRELVREAVSRPELYSSKFGRPQTPAPESVAEQVRAIEAQGWPYVPTMLTADPPEHHYYRRLVARAFTPRTIGAQEWQATALATTMIEELLAGGEVDFVSRFAAPYPLTVIARVLAVPEERLPEFRVWSDEITRAIGADISDEQRLHGARQLLEFQRYFAGQLELRRANPRDGDLLSGLVHAHEMRTEDPDGTDESTDEDQPLSIAACLSILMQLLVAGNETTTKLLTEMVHQLARHPRWWRWLREDPRNRAAAVVEETLRHLTPVQGMFRVVTRDTTLGDVDLPAGSRIVLSYASANREDDTFADPDTFDPGRPNLREHLAFGSGIHHCLGAALSRLEARVVLQELVRLVDSIELVGDEPRYQPSFLLRGLARLDVRLHPSINDAPEAR